MARACRAEDRRGGRHVHRPAPASRFRRGAHAGAHRPDRVRQEPDRGKLAGPCLGVGHGVRTMGPRDRELRDHRPLQRDDRCRGAAGRGKGREPRVVRPRDHVDPGSVRRLLDRAWRSPRDLHPDERAISGHSGVAFARVRLDRFPRDGSQHGPAACERAGVRGHVGTTRLVRPQLRVHRVRRPVLHDGGQPGLCLGPQLVGVPESAVQRRGAEPSGLARPGRDPERHRQWHVRPRTTLRHRPRRQAPAHPALDAGHRGRPVHVAAPLGLAHHRAAVGLARRHVGHLPGWIAGGERRHRPLRRGRPRAHRVRRGAAARSRVCRRCPPRDGRP